jgi:hypothetical protein
MEIQIVPFTNKAYNSEQLSNRVILVKSDSNPNKVYEVRCGPYECSCPDYARQSAPWLKGESYLCKHMRRLLTLDIPEQEMLSVIEATDGEIETFLKNYSFTNLLLLYFRQLVIFDKKKITILK